MNLEIASLITVGIVIVALAAVNVTLDWAADQYSVTFSPFRVTRRWYGTRAHLCRRGHEGDQAPVLYVVLQRDTENLAVPWLKVCQLDEEHPTKWAEDATPFWAAVTDFAPYSVRKFRPHLVRYGTLVIPWFSWWLPLRRPSGFLDGAR